MSANKDSINRTVLVALVLCVACSIVVSAAAVLLKPLQQRNAEIDRKANILRAAGIVDPSKSVEELFARVTPKLVDMTTGEVLADYQPALENYRRSASDPAISRSLERSEDIASIKRLANVMPVYIIEDEQGGIAKLILPVHGYGLWSTMYGFLALESDLNTVAGLGFYEHAETPGLGGEIDNVSWKASWVGKKIFSDNVLMPELKVIKGKVDPAVQGAEYRIDGLAGATLTSKGVTNMIGFWLGESGYAPLLNNLRSTTELSFSPIESSSSEALASENEV